MNKKFIESIDIQDWQVETDSGFVDILQIHKTIEYDIWYIQTENGYSLKCADTHILFDENMNEIFVKDIVVNNTKIQTKNGISTIIQCYNTSEKDNMYDLTIDSNDHRYYTNDILSHNTTCVSVYACHQVLFNDFCKIAILANKDDKAKDIIKNIKLMYENLPLWMQQGITAWNKHEIELENGSKIVVSPTSSSSARGDSYRIVILDEFAFIPFNMQEDFFRSVYPTISSGETTKMIIISTPKGFEKFYKIYTDAVEKRNNYVPFNIEWNQVPGRDEEFKKRTIADLGLNAWRQEYECSFLGSQNTLIDSSIIENLTYSNPIEQSLDEKSLIYFHPENEHQYIAVVDVSDGVGLDYTVINVIDVTELPYKQVAIYRDNMISPSMLPEIIYKFAIKYNNAWILVENNFNGSLVNHVLHNDLEYENIVMTTIQGRKGQSVTFGVGNNISFGVKTTALTKRLGCSQFKALVESHNIIISDFNSISEISSFIAKENNTYSAEEGKNDDIVMTFVLFSWLINQQYFKDMINIDVRKKMADDYEKFMIESILPFGFIYNGEDEKELDSSFL